jgi:hypothetical protein
MRNSGTDDSVMLPTVTDLSCQSVQWNPAMESPENWTAPSTLMACWDVHQRVIDEWAVTRPEPIERPYLARDNVKHDPKLQ